MSGHCVVMIMPIRRQQPFKNSIFTDNDIASFGSVKQLSNTVSLRGKWSLQPRSVRTQPHRSPRMSAARRRTPQDHCRRPSRRRAKHPRSSSDARSHGRASSSPSPSCASCTSYGFVFTKFSPRTPTRPRCRTTAHACATGRRCVSGRAPSRSARRRRTTRGWPCCRRTGATTRWTKTP